MVDGASFSFHGSGGPFKALSRFFATPKIVLWRRWRLAVPLATVPAALVVWLGVLAAPRLHPFNSGWRTYAVAAVLVAGLLFTWYLLGRWRSVKRWAHGPFPPPATVGPAAERGWYLQEPIRHRRLALLLYATPMALVHFWVQAAQDDGGRTLDGGVAFAAFIFWAGIIRGLSTPGEPAIAVTASGVSDGVELYRWEEIGRVWVEESLVGIVVNGRDRYLKLPLTDLKADDVSGVISYYLERPHERGGIALVR